MQNLFLSVVIPCYNEEENLKRGVLKEVFDFMKTKKFSWEVVVSDDGPTDDSRDILDKQITKFKNFRHLKNLHGGKPSALMHGIKAANGKYVLFTDMDQSTPIDQLDKLLPYVEEGFDIVIGSRGFERKDFPIYRKLGSVIFASFRKIMLLRDINDTQCGFKLFKKEVVTKAFPKLQFFRSKERTVGWKVTSYDVELLHIMEMMGLKIKEVVVKWNDKDVSKSKGGGTARYFKESKEMIVQILRVKWNDILGRYSA